MEKEILLEMLRVNRFNCGYTFKEMNAESAGFRLNEKTASAGFIYRHITETTNTLGQYLGFGTEVKDTTMGKSDTGMHYNIEESSRLLDEGYDKLEQLVRALPAAAWMETIAMPFFGTVTRIKLLSIILFHNSHHCGQAASALVKGKKFAPTGTAVLN